MNFNRKLFAYKQIYNDFQSSMLFSLTFSE